MALRTLLKSIGFVMALAPQAVPAADAETPVIDRVQALLIYEDTGKLSKDVSGDADHIVATDRKNGSSIQMLVNVVLKSEPDRLYENNPVLHVRATSVLSSDGSPKTVEDQFHITYVAETGQLVRSIVVDHGCEGFALEAYVTAGDKRTSEFRKSYSVFCGD